MKRGINKIFYSQPTIDGAGVYLNRVFANAQVPDFDPFLLLDAFGSNDKAKYLKGFPWHPHRGIETITYIQQGKVEHKDSMGNSGVIYSGDVQWMTAGSGIIHEEMPKGDGSDAMFGFQLWANLPASNKMMPPRYRDVRKGEIPEIVLEDGTKIKIICGTVNGTQGPVKDIVTDPEYLDVSIPANTLFSHSVKTGHTVFAFIYEGSAGFGDGDEKMMHKGTAVLFTDGDEVEIKTKEEHAKLLLISGKPIKEQIAWHGPIVMNTQQELEVAFEEFNNGTFIKDPKV